MSIICKIPAGRRVNLTILATELGRYFDVLKRPRLGGLPQSDWIFDVTGEDAEASALQAICDAHSPAQTEDELSAASAENTVELLWRARIRKILAYLLQDAQFINALKNALGLQ